MSLGRCYAGHSLKHKLFMAAKHGLEGIELFYEDLADHASSQSASDLLAAAASIRAICDALGLEIICLQVRVYVTNVSGTCIDSQSRSCTMMGC